VGENTKTVVLTG